MLALIKDLLRKSGLFLVVSDVAGIPSLIRWLAAGCPAPSPPAIKRRIVRSYLQQYGLKVFVETGTFYGDTLAYMAKTGAKCFSVELSAALYEKARSRFRGNPAVKLFQGDSRIVLGQIVEPLREPALFWLDGHFSGGETARGTGDTPVADELEFLLNRPGGERDVVLIDDARCFDGTCDYPDLAEIILRVSRLPGRRIEISNDIIRVTPQLPSHGEGCTWEGISNEH
jgi:SAM-dependent methyltransferase